MVVCLEQSANDLCMVCTVPLATDENIRMDTTQVTCGLSKGPCRHKETWWWNEEVAEQ